VGFADEFVDDLKACGAPEDPSEEDLGRLLAAYARSAPRAPGGPPDLARDALILSLALPVYRLTLRYRNRDNAPDILGEAMLALVECVDRWWSVADDDNIRAYVEFTVRRRIKDFIDNDAVFAVPSRRVRERKAAGEESGVPVRHPIRSILDPPDDAPQDGPHRGTPEVPPDDTYDAVEFFRSRPDWREWVIAEMRAAGRPYGEIAAAVGRGKTWVYDRLGDLRRDYHRASAG
jgi:DNA-directed RNA polymerase specialized sigma24 family protein